MSFWDADLPQLMNEALLPDASLVDLPTVVSLRSRAAMSDTLGPRSKRVRLIFTNRASGLWNIFIAPSWKNERQGKHESIQATTRVPTTKHNRPNSDQRKHDKAIRRSCVRRRRD
jgi:hypothetical protein